MKTYKVYFIDCGKPDFAFTQAIDAVSAATNIKFRFRITAITAVKEIS